MVEEEGERKGEAGSCGRRRREAKGEDLGGGGGGEEEFAGEEERRTKKQEKEKRADVRSSRVGMWCSGGCVGGCLMVVRLVVGGRGGEGTL